MVNNILSNILYGLSGFFFAMFALRYGIRSTDKMRIAFHQHGFSTAFFLACIPSIIFMVLALILFPILLYTRTPVGGFVYLATYIFFSMKVRMRR
jgi:hypothetical protein